LSRLERRRSPNGSCTWAVERLEAARLQRRSPRRADRRHRHDDYERVLPRHGHRRERDHGRGWIGPVRRGNFQAIVAIFTREEERFSRFREDSELSIVNRSVGTWVEVSRPFAEVVGLALDGAASTGGLFDPTVLAALTAAGYDRDWSEIDRGALITMPAPVPCGRWVEIEIRDRHVRLPRGVGIDLGGLAKGWTADLAAEAPSRSGSPGCSSTPAATCA
jgi:hypothetical protein